MGIVKNFAWNLLLTISGYIFPLLTFPYVTRILGPSNFGMVNFAFSIVDYAILFSTFGVSIVGIRYIAQNSKDTTKLNEVFSGLISFHIILSAFVLLAYFICVYTVPQLNEHSELYCVGAAKIIANVFVVEWLFQGMQNFRYITIRTIAVRLLYVIAVLLFVRTREDYYLYFYITIFQTIVNSIINWRYSKYYTRFVFSFNSIRQFIIPVFSMGFNTILLSFYSTFNTIYLGFTCDNESVGFFTTAVKLYAIFITLVTAYNSVFVPYLNTLYSEHNLKRFSSIVTKSLGLITMLSIPVICISIILAPEIIYLIAGPGYERAILPFQIISMQIFIVGFTQIFEKQILLAFNQYNYILIATSVTTALSVLIIVFFVPVYAEVAAALAITIPHILEFFLLYMYARRALEFNLPLKDIFINIVICVPIVLFTLFLKCSISNYVTELIVIIIFAVVYCFITHYFVLKNTFVVEQVARIKKYFIESN